MTNIRDSRLVKIHPAPRPWPAVRILNGSTVVRVVWGITRRHAIARARRLLGPSRPRSM